MATNRSKATRPRRTQEERRDETRGAVLEATVDCLAQRGYARTTTTRIARRARVSRGALLHYYPSKAELLTSAVEHILQRRTEEFRSAFAELPATADRRAAAIDILWRMFSGSTFYAWLELVVAARSDRKLHEQVAQIAARFAATVLNTYRELFADSAAPDLFFDLVPAFTFAFLQGLALEQITLGDDSRAGDLLQRLKELAQVILGPKTRPSDA